MNTPAPDIPEDRDGVPAAELKIRARSHLVTAIREAALHRQQEFDALKDRMTELDEEWADSITAAWAAYDGAMGGHG
jgi:hypothetical protein